jgi:hypothetical protein
VRLRIALAERFRMLPPASNSQSMSSPAPNITETLPSWIPAESPSTALTSSAQSGQRAGNVTAPIRTTRVRPVRWPAEHRLVPLAEVLPLHLAQNRGSGLIAALCG